MAVAQEFANLFVRITDVERVYPGGMAGYLDWAGDERRRNHLARRAPVARGSYE